MLHHEWRHKTEIPSLRNLIQELHQVSFRWHELGTVLGIPLYMLESIQVNYRMDPHRSLVEVLQVWLRNSPQPTWEAIVNALKIPFVGEPRLAMEIEAKYLDY